MSFRMNSYQQLSLTDSFSGLTSREQKALEHSWAKTFAEDIFPFINEKPFEVLYSSNASRPNTPVNVCIGALTFLFLTPTRFLCIPLQSVSCKRLLPHPFLPAA